MDFKKHTFHSTNEVDSTVISDPSWVYESDWPYHKGRRGSYFRPFYSIVHSYTFTHVTRYNCANCVHKTRWTVQRGTSSLPTLSYSTLTVVGNPSRRSETFGVLEDRSFDGRITPLLSTIVLVRPSKSSMIMILSNYLSIRLNIVWKTWKQLHPDKVT